jgi:4'-phosphopantetheinyl transferase
MCRARGKVGPRRRLLERTRESRVDVWSLPLLLPPDTASLLHGTLSDEETEALSGIAEAGRRERVRVAWAVRRTVIAHTLTCAPRDVRIVRPWRGAPTLDMPGRRLHFSLSHSGDAMLFAISDAVRVGVDLEQIDDEVSPVRLARRFFTAREADEIERLSSAAARDVFFRLWTRKEAVLKGVGGGVPSRLRAVPVALAPGRCSLSIGGVEWTIADLPVPEGYAGALAVSGHATVIPHTTLDVDLGRSR